MITEPSEAFPYKPPTKKLRETYKEIFELSEPIQPSCVKLIFDKAVASLTLLIAMPILVILKLAFIVEGILFPENAGPMFFYYRAVSGGKVIRKYKIRLIKVKCIQQDAAKKHEWIAYAAEWKKECRTYVGSFVKKYYLDELPQFWSVLRGDMSIVGPRPLSELHYERDKAQGNVVRGLLRGGLLGFGHINKGTDQMGEPSYEYEYLDKTIKLSPFGLLKTDLWIIWRGIIVIFKGGGH